MKGFDELTQRQDGQIDQDLSLMKINYSANSIQ
jgi:hypothetical protein